MGNDEHLISRQRVMKVLLIVCCLLIFHRRISYGFKSSKGDDIIIIGGHGDSQLPMVVDQGGKKGKKGVPTIIILPSSIHPDSHTTHSYSHLSPATANLYGSASYDSMSGNLLPSFTFPIQANRLALGTATKFSPFVTPLPYPKKGTSTKGTIAKDKNKKKKKKKDGSKSSTTTTTKPTTTESTTERPSEELHDSPGAAREHLLQALARTRYKPFDEKPSEIVTYSDAGHEESDSDAGHEGSGSYHYEDAHSHPHSHYPYPKIPQIVIKVPAPIVNVPQPIVNVSPPIVHVPQPEINIPPIEVPQPIVNVPQPKINIEIPKIEVPPAIVNVPKKLILRKEHRYKKHDDHHKYHHHQKYDHHHKYDASGTDQIDLEEEQSDTNHLASKKNQKTITFDEDYYEYSITMPPSTSYKVGKGENGRNSQRLSGPLNQIQSTTPSTTPPPPTPSITSKLPISAHLRHQPPYENFSQNHQSVYRHEYSTTSPYYQSSSSGHYQMPHSSHLRITVPVPVPASNHYPGYSQNPSSTQLTERPTYFRDHQTTIRDLLQNQKATFTEQEEVEFVQSKNPSRASKLEILNDEQKEPNVIFERTASLDDQVNDESRETFQAEYADKDGIVYDDYVSHRTISTTRPVHLRGNDFMIYQDQRRNPLFADPEENEDDED